MRNKQAETRYPLHELLAARWSPRAFSERPVSHEALGSLLEAARWAPSSYNAQPWSFVVGRKDDPGTFEKLREVLVPANQAWAGEAPVLMLSVARLDFAHDGKANTHALYDLGAAVALLTVQAETLGLSVHQMGGFDPERARRVFDVPADHSPVTVIAIGYRAEPSSLPEELARAEEAARDRKPLSEMAFAGSWGETDRRLF